MTDHRIDLALRFAEDLILLQDFSAMKAAKLAAAAHDVDADALVVEWVRRLLAKVGRAAHPARAGQRLE